MIVSKSIEYAVETAPANSLSLNRYSPVFVTLSPEGYMYCPICKTHLRLINAAGLELDQCPDCHGVWFDKNELRPFVEFALKHFEAIPDADYDAAKQPTSIPGSGETNLSCPACASELSKFNYAVDSNVILDRCPNCEGLWVEQPEVQELASFLKGNPDQERHMEARANWAAHRASFPERVAQLVGGLYAFNATEGKRDYIRFRPRKY